MIGESIAYMPIARLFYRFLGFVLRHYLAFVENC
jgi:hypothetical protein